MRTLIEINQRIALYRAELLIAQANQDGHDVMLIQRSIYELEWVLSQKGALIV